MKKFTLLVVLLVSFIWCVQAQNFRKSAYKDRNPRIKTDTVFTISESQYEPTSYENLHMNVWRPLTLDVIERRPDFEMKRGQWLKNFKNKSYVQNLKQISDWQGQICQIEVLFDKEGNVYTLIFQITKRLYDQLPKDWIKNTFSELKQEKIAADYFFDFDKPTGTSVQEPHLGWLRIDVYELLFDAKILPQSGRDFNDEDREVRHSRRKLQD